MSLPDRIAAYDDCLAAFDRAKESGARVCFASEGEAKHFVSRLHRARSLLREENQRLFTRDDIRWGKTDYDKLIVRAPAPAVEEGFWWVYIEIFGSNIITIEALDPPTYVKDSDNAA